MTYSVLLVEDQNVTRQWLAHTIRSNEQLSLVGEAADMETATKMLSTYKPDVLVTDITLPDGNGIDLVRATQKIKNCQSIVISAKSDESFVVEAIQAGAQGYLLKDSTSEQISDSVSNMLKGGSPISPTIARCLLEHYRLNTTQKNAETSPISKTQPSLTSREQQVLDFIAKGNTYGDIAQKLCISIHTVNSHIKQLYRKLDVGSRGAAVYEATQMGLIRAHE